MGARGGLVGLHSARGGEPPRIPDTVELVLVADEPLAVADRLRAAGYAHEPVADEAFGRFFHVVDPDGLAVQVQEHDPTRYP